MHAEPIHKAAPAVVPNLVDYEEARRTFTWAGARELLDGLPDGGLNIAHEAVVRHAAGERRDHVALVWLAKNGERRELTYGDLDAQTNRMAGALASLGVRAGDTVFTLLGRVPELHVTMLGALKLGAVVSPLFSAFGPEPIRQRMQLGHGRVLVTSRALYRRKVASVRAELPQLRHVLLVDEPDPDVPGAHDLRSLLAAQSATFAIPPTSPDQLALLHFTSGTTGTPKGAMHVHEAVVAHHATARLALDLRADDVYWCTADPGWVTGTSYGVIAPLTIGATVVVDEAEFDAARWYATLSARTRQRLVHRADRGADDDARRPTFRPTITIWPPCGSLPASVSRSTRKPCSGASRRSGCRSTTTGGKPRRAGS